MNRNALGVNASALGNHEFDLGSDDVAGLLLADGDYPGAAFPYLSANLDFSTDGDLTPLIGDDGALTSALHNKVAAYTTIVVDGETIGIVGATTPTLDNISSPGDVTIAPADSSDVSALAADIQASVDALEATDVNKIILLAHMQSISIERQLAGLLSGVDVIVAGGSNTILADDNDRLRDGDTAADDYPLSLTDVDNNPVLVVNVDGDYTYVGRLQVGFDEAGLVIPELLDDDVNGAWATDAQGLTENGLTNDDVDSDVQAISDALAAELEVKAGNVVGSTSVYLNGERASVRTEESNLGNLTADANLWYAQSVDVSTSVSIKNGGGIRAAIGSCVIPAGSTSGDDLVCSAPREIVGVTEEGQVSQLDLETALRFNNGLTLVTVTGAELVALLENGVSQVENVSGRFPQVAGVEFSYDPTATAGERIVGLTVLDSNGAEAGGGEVVIVADGVLDTPASEQNFRIVSLSFLVGGGDDYPFPDTDVVQLEQEGTATGTFTFSDDGTEQDVLAEYMNQFFPADGSNPYDEADTEADQRIQTVE